MKAVLPVQQVRRTAAVTTAAYVELDSALNEDINGIHISSTMDQDLELAIGPAGSEQTVFLIPAGNSERYDEFLPILLSKGIRLSAKAYTGDTTAGTLLLSLFK